MSKTDNELREMMEPDVEGLPMQIACPISMAISMRRIADFICGSQRNDDMVDYLSRRLTERRW